MCIASTGQKQLQDAYKDQDAAAKYVQERFANELNRLLHDRQSRVVNRLIARVAPRSVLELAPGPARLTWDVRHGGLLVCLEYNQAMIDAGRTALRDQCRSGNARVLWVRGNGFALPFSQCFDLVYTFRFIRHFRHEDRASLYEQIRRVLRPGGWLVFDAVNQRVSAPLRQAYPEQYPIYDKLYPDQSELRSELAAAGYELLEAEPVQRWFSAQYQAQVLLGPRSRWLCRLVIRTLERLRRGPALEWIVTCRRA